MAASAASPAHQGRLVLVAVLAGGLIVLGIVFARKYLSSKKKSSTSTEETSSKKEENKEVKEVVAQEDIKKVEAIKEESEPEPESEPELQPEPEPEPKSELQPKPEPKSELQPEPEPKSELQPKPEPKSEPKSELQPKPEPKSELQPEPEPKSELQPEPEPKSELQPEPEPKLELQSEPQLKSEPVLKLEPEQKSELIVPAKPEAGDTLSSTLKVELKPSDPEHVHRRGISVSPARFLPSPTPESAPVQEIIESTEVKTTESAPVQEIIESTEVKTTESAPVQEIIESAEVKTTESAAPVSSASEPEASVTESASEETDGNSAEAEEAASSGPTEEPTQENECVAEEAEEQKSAKDVLVKPEESKLDPKAEPFMPRDSSLLQQFTPTDDSIVSEIVASGMGGESLAEPIEKEADLEELSDDGAVVSNEVESENLSVEMEELKEAAAAVVKSGPQSIDFEMHEQPLSTCSDYVVIDPDQANNNSTSPQSSEGEHQLPPGQYDDAEEHQKAAEHDLNSDSPFDFFDLATSPNDFKPSFDFVDPNENLTLQRGSDEDIEVINDHKGLDEDEYIPDMVLEDVQVEAPPDYSADDISSALYAANNNPDIIGTRQLEVLVSLILSKDYDIQQAAMAGVVKCAAFTDNQNSLRELGCPKTLAILLKSYVMSMKVGYNVSTALISSVANAISNMSVNDKNQIVLQETVPLLVDLTVESDMKESALLSTLRALTNLSTTDRHHGQYTCMVQHLYNLMDAGSTPVKLQALKILVNLSCSSDMVQHLLAAKAPHSLLELLQQDAEEALVLRWTTLLANIVHTVRVNKMSQSSLPCPDKAASPETMYTAVYGVHSMGDLKSKIFLLSKHKNEDIRYQAARVYSGLVR